MLQDLLDVFGYCEAPDELYDRFANPKIKVTLRLLLVSAETERGQSKIINFCRNLKLLK